MNEKAGKKISCKLLSSLYSTVVVRQSCKLKAPGSIPGGGTMLLLLQYKAHYWLDVRLYPLQFGLGLFLETYISS